MTGTCILDGYAEGWTVNHSLEEKVVTIDGHEAGAMSLTVEMYRPERGRSWYFVEQAYLFDGGKCYMLQYIYDTMRDDLKYTYDPERDVLFSDPYLKSAQCIVVNSANTEITEIADIVGMTVGAGPGTTGEAAAMDAGANCTSMGDYVQMFEILKNGGLDAIACDEAVALKYGELDEFTVLEERLISEEVSIITENSKTALMDALNAAIEEFMASEDYTSLKAEHGLN